METIKKNLEEKSVKTISVLKEDLNTVRAGRANPALLDKVKREMATPGGFTSAQMVRYSINKDVNSRFEESINAINPEKVRSFLGNITSGGLVEYINE